jgi:hypothetical protein
MIPKSFSRREKTGAAVRRIEPQGRGATAIAIGKSRAALFPQMKMEPFDDLLRAGRQQQHFRRPAGARLLENRRVRQGRQDQDRAATHRDIRPEPSNEFDAESPRENPREHRLRLQPADDIACQQDVACPNRRHVEAVVAQRRGIHFRFFMEAVSQRDADHNLVYSKSRTAENVIGYLIQSRT